MKKLFFLLLFLLPVCTHAQKGPMLVYTVAGNDTASDVDDGRPATAAGLAPTEGIWLDGSCNLYISTVNCIRRVSNATGIISTIAGNGPVGYFGDGGPATNAKISSYGVYVDAISNVYIADAGNNRIRKVDAITGIISTFAGNGIPGYNGDEIPATNAQLNDPVNVYGDNTGNIYIGENYGRIRKINTLGIISTFAGNGIRGYAGDGGPATNAQIAGPSTMLFDTSGNFYFADRGNSIIRKINTKGIITTFAGTPGVFDFSGNGGPATAAKLSGPISFVVDYMGNMVIGDNQNNCMRKVDAHTNIITTIAGVGPSSAGSSAEGVPASAADMHPEFMYLDRSGNIYYSCYCSKVRKVTNYYPGELYGANDCGETGVPEVQQTSDKVNIYPNPANDLLHIDNLQTQSTYHLLSIVGATVQQGALKEGNNTIPILAIPSGVYMLEVCSADRQRTVFKVVKE